jgi:hypothetical protein
MSQKEYESLELPGVGEIRARPGTSTLELAGAAKFWHDKYKSARLDGFIGGVSISAMAALIVGAVLYLWR